MPVVNETVANGLAAYYEYVAVQLHQWVDPLSNEQFWRKPYVYGNSAGHLVLHMTGDRKSTRLNSSHQIISYAVFCLKKKKTPVCSRYSLQRQGHCCRAATSLPRRRSSLAHRLRPLRHFAVCTSRHDYDLSVCFLVLA